jgi:phage portal protein BeeE
VIKTLTKHGNSYALIIDRPILELLNITPEMPMSVTTDGDVLVVTPIRDEAETDGRAAKIAKIREKIHHKYAKTFEGLAK